MRSFGFATVVAGCTAAVREALRHAAHPAPPVEFDEAEIDALFVRAAQDFDGALTALMTARLRPVVLRRVPVKAVRPAPAPHTARVLFADGTVVIARGHRPGDLGQLSVGVLLHPPVCLVACRRVNGTTHLEFVLHHSRRLTALAVGLDQAD